MDLDLAVANQVQLPYASTGRYLPDTADCSGLKGLCPNREMFEQRS